MDTSGSTPDFDHFLAVNEYGFYCVPTEFRNREVPKILSNGDVYEPKTLRFMKRWARPGDIVSGGAFIGDFFPALSQAVAGDNKIYSFEPNPISFAAAQHTIAINHLTNVHLYPVAVGDKKSKLPLLIARGKDDDSMAARAKIVKDASVGKTIEVDVTTLDDLIPDLANVSILHLDIEGHEMAAIQGATNLLKASHPVVILEAAKPFRRRAYLSALNEIAPDAGYQIAGVMERNCFFLPAS